MCLEGCMQRASPTCREERGAERAASPHRPTLHPHFHSLKLHLYNFMWRKSHLSENLEAVLWGLGVSGTQKHQRVRR